jgi:hypothetical protein
MKISNLHRRLFTGCSAFAGHDESELKAVGITGVAPAAGVSVRAARAWRATRAGRGAASGQLLNLAWVAAVRGSAADGVGRLDADRQVEVSALGIERIVAG